MGSSKVLIDSIAEKMRQGDNFELLQRLKQMVVSNNALLQRREFERTGQFRDTAIITINCAELIEIDPSECCETKTGCIIYRTADTIPRPINVKGSVNFPYVGAVALKKEAWFIKPYEFRFIPSRRFTSNGIFYTYMNDYLYFYNVAILDEAEIVYAPANPVEVKEKYKCSGKCFNQDEWILDDDLEPIIREMIYKELGITPEQGDKDEIQVDGKVAK